MNYKIRNFIETAIYAVVTIVALLAIVAAYDAGLDFVGLEIDPDYFKAQEERFAAHAAQMSLFN